MAHDAAACSDWKTVSSAGVVAAGGAPAVAAGIGVLDRGGNAADSAVATILALTITDHGECCIGGEVPLLIYDASRREGKGPSGQGRAPLSPTAIEWYLRHGIPAGDIRMAPVPAVVDLCLTTLQRYGTRTFAEVVAPTLDLLDAGTEPWHPRLARTLRRLVEEEGLTAGTREQKLQAASDRFYGRHPLRNDVAEELEAFYVERGGFLRRADLAAHHTPVEDPVTVAYRGYTVCKCGP
ncbi:MAG: gamma-glutamyltransferase, partial [Candidatus Latescibacterota bacterium]